jgi:hypothetical protein
MARLVKLDRNCENGCGRRQTVILLDLHRNPRGRYCQLCGDKRLAELQADEDRHYGPVPEPPPELEEGKLL